MRSSGDEFYRGEYPKVDSSEFKYQGTTLMGEWFERRLVVFQDKHAIVPAVVGQAPCSNAVSVYRGDYQPHYVDVDKLERANNFLLKKMEALSIRKKIMNSSIKVYHGDEYIKNNTTSFDVAFNIQPQLARKMQPKNELSSLAPLSEDPLKSYGNYTNYGIRNYLRNEQLKGDQIHCYSHSVYQETYTPKQAIATKTRFPRKATSLTKMKKK